MLDWPLLPEYRNWFGIEVFSNSRLYAAHWLIRSSSTLWWQVLFLSCLQLDANDPSMWENCSGVHSYTKITETEPLTRHKSNNSVYDGIFYWIDNIIKMLTKIQDAILFQMQSRSHLLNQSFSFYLSIKWNALTKICGGMCGWAVNTSNSRSGGLGFKPHPSRCFLRQETLLHFFSHHPGI